MTVHWQASVTPDQSVPSHQTCTLITAEVYRLLAMLQACIILQACVTLQACDTLQACVILQACVDTRAILQSCIYLQKQIMPLCGITLEGTTHVFKPGSLAHPVHVHTASACLLSSASPQVL